MIEKPLIIIIFFYISSFMFLGTQFMLGDVLGVSMVNWEGEKVDSSLLTLMDIDSLTSSTDAIADTDYDSDFLDTITGGLAATAELLMLLTGTYVFSILYFFGVNPIIVGGMAIVYMIMMGRTFIAYLRGF